VLREARIALRRDRRRYAAALAASTAIHALLVLLLMSSGRETATPRHASEAIPVEIVPVPPSETRDAGATPLDGGKVSRDRPPRVRHGPASRPSGEPPPARGSREWFEAEGLAPSGPRLDPGRLSVPADRVWGDAESDPAPPGEAAGDPAKASQDPAAVAKFVKDRLDSWFVELKAVQRAEVPDSYWSNVRRRLASGLRVEWSILDKRSGPTPVASVREIGAALERYSHAARRYGASGNPYGTDPSSKGAKRSLADDVRDLDVGSGGLSASARGLLEAGRPESTFFHRQIVAVVRIAQQPDGAVSSIDLVEGSGNRDYDLAALQSAWSLTEGSPTAVGPPPKQGHTTAWAFTTHFRIAPPIPMVACAFDVYFKPQECTWPLKRTVTSEVRLRGIY
jgi:hypothetical protein